MIAQVTSFVVHVLPPDPNAHVIMLELEHHSSQIKYLILELQLAQNLAPMIGKTNWKTTLQDGKI
jgi:hypothetical protein